MPTFEELPRMTEKDLLIEIYKELMSSKSHFNNEFRKVKSELSSIERKIDSVKRNI